MTRPASHASQPHPKSCSNCALSHLVANKLDLLCFHGDNIEVTGHSNYPVTSDYVVMDGEEVGLLEGDEYDRIWSDRIVNPDDVCDEWIDERLLIQSLDD